MQWFKHNKCASLDEKIAHLINAEGAKGYGTYWYIIEMLCVQPDREVKFSFLNDIQKKGFSTSYMKRIITDYNLFEIKEDSFSSMILYQIGKDDSLAKTKEGDLANTSDKDSSSLEQTFDEHSSNSQQMPSNQTALNNGDNNLTNSILQTENDSSSRARTYVEKNREEKNKTTAEREKEKSAAAANLFNPDPPLRPVRPLQKLIDELTEDSTWIELACMKSLYGILLKQHFKEAVEYFRHHIMLYDKGRKLLFRDDVRQYFVNFVSAGSRTSIELHKYLSNLNANTAPPNPYRYERIIDGKRTYGGQPIPADAPPRPDEFSVWNSMLRQWVSLKKRRDN